MSDYEPLKHRLARIGHDAARLIDEAGTIVDLEANGLARWKAVCQTISEQISDVTMRVAVVGAIKSGKSTLVNALFGADYLKRGAGVVTSIVTRVRIGDRLRATLYLKNWDELNQEINQASALLPAHYRSDEHPSFDIRREKDRRLLEAALGDLSAEQLITNDTRSAGSVLLASCLRGYDRVQQLVEADHTTVVFEGDRFPAHRDFVGDDALAVYLKDVLLELDRPGLGGQVEVADCQGSDSPNPLHLAMIQDYLMMAHLTVYVISSRTGLRQADIRFLSMIRKMGILETVVFVVNCDLSEHESLDDLSQGIGKIEADLRLISPEPRVFSFSALFALMEQTESNLSYRERDRLAHWRRETAMVDFSTAERDRLRHFLEHTISRERNALLLRNHLERLEITADDISDWIAFNRNLLDRDTGSVRELAERIHHQRERLQHLDRTLKSTLDGAVSQIKRDLKIAVDRFFDQHAAGLVDAVVHFIRSYPVETQRYDETLLSVGFTKTLYMVFQDFRQAVDAHMTETVNPQVMRFVREQEADLIDRLDQIAGPYGAMIDEALAQYADAIDPAAPNRRRSGSAVRLGTELETIRKVAGLALPPAAATMRYSAQVKSAAVMRFGFYKVVNLVRRALKKPADKARQEQFLALTSGIKRMKHETERAVVFHLKDYKENIKFQYLLKLADASAAALLQRMLERFQHQGADLTRLVERLTEQGLDKETVTSALDRMGPSCHCLKERIVHLKSDLQQLYP